MLSRNYSNFIHIFKIEIRNREMYLPEVSVSSTMARGDAEEYWSVLPSGLPL